MNAAALAQQFGVDEGTVASILKLAEQQSELESTEVTGFASCINQGCEMLGTDRPVQMRVEWSNQTYQDLGGNLGFTDRSTEHHSLVDDSELICPSCQEPCALLPGARRKVPKSQWTAS